MNLPARHSSVRELLAIQGLLQFLAEVDTRHVLDAVEEQVVDTFVRGWDRRLVERLSKCPPEVGITAEAPLLGLRSEQGPHLHDVRLRDVARAAVAPLPPAQEAQLRAGELSIHCRVWPESEDHEL